MRIPTKKRWVEPAWRCYQCMQPLEHGDGCLGWTTKSHISSRLSSAKPLTASFAAEFTAGNQAEILKPLFHSSQKPTRTPAASAFSGLKLVLAASLRVGFCNH